MIDEPIYTFVKGQGWIPNVASGIITTLKDGKSYRIENRTPNDGEWYDSWRKPHMYDDLNYYSRYAATQRDIYCWPTFKSEWFIEENNYIVMVPLNNYIVMVPL